METAVVMLRGVNVSGRNRLPMDDLRRLVADLGCRDVETYIQSGNVVCRVARPVDELGPALAAGLESELGLTVPVIVRTGNDPAGVVRSNPLLAEGADPGFLHVTFLSAEPGADRVGGLDGRATGDDTFRLVGREVFLSCPGGYGNTKLTNALCERVLGVQATTRNWRTVERLAAMADR